MAFHQNVVLAPRPGLVFKQVANITGGLLGGKHFPFEFEAHFERDTFYLNEKIGFRLITRNGQCHKPVDKFTVALMRTFHADAMGVQSTQKRYVHEIFLPGVAGNYNDDRRVEFHIPMDERYPPALQN